MCLFAYPPPKSKKSKKAKRETKKSSNGYIDAAAYEALDEFSPAMPYGREAADAPYPNWYYYPYGMEQWYEENRPAYITKGQWNSYSETLNSTLDTTTANGKKMDEMKSSLTGGFKDTQTAVKGVHDTLKETCDAIKKNHGEYSSKQDGCAEEIGKVRKYLEDEAKQREEACKRQQDMRESWYYSQWLRQAERDAEAGSTRSQASSRSGSSSEKSHRRRARSEEQREADRRELKRDVLEYLRKVFGEAGHRPPPPADSFHSHGHGHGFAQAPPPWAAGGDAWQQQYPFSSPSFPGPGDFHVPRHPPMPPPGRGPRHPRGYM
ncbi:hypothetical protein GGR52DRAFT_571147 [Hypoxylon sp. FL1284]|nr:hypothetical protein GGR52DRAFT_571147 [Hypoxylon sp. FL1284]